MQTQRSSSAATITNGCGTAPPLLSTRFLRTLNTWKSSSSRVLASTTKYADYTVVAGDDDPSADQHITRTSDDLPTFACRLESPPTPASPTETTTTNNLPTTGVFDVLLQKDAKGLGFCLAVDDRTHEALVVTSFRRLHAGDIGPAEASKAILPGDALIAINGEPVYSLHQVQSKIAALDESAFLLLRFRRGSIVHEVCDQVAPVRGGATTMMGRSQHSTMSQRELQMATTLHDMAVKNELLVTQLSEANVKSTAQAREIDLLRAEVMQLRLDRDMQSQSASRGWTHGLTRPSKATAKQELDLVVTEAHNELKRSALQHLALEKDEIRADARRQVEQWKASVIKKQGMLEDALLFMVDHVDDVYWASESKGDDTPENTKSSNSKLTEIRTILDKYYATRQQDRHTMLSLVQQPSPAKATALA
ncbi:hypothetical protein B5M09_004151 [Aphanomyces astaci]|uniref:PDZ domain-containing protein n=1 Tax=Aphanomyces astaci TaxID=112090 RepID=A0A425CV83_APHAT|nr:hypothetical protein B5M09_004151 [Aphanomyces astaci]